MCGSSSLSLKSNQLEKIASRLLTLLTTGRSVTGDLCTFGCRKKLLIYAVVVDFVGSRLSLLWKVCLGCKVDLTVSILLLASFGVSFLYVPVSRCSVKICLMPGFCL